eukprot:4513550-Alexandrium_andersonii.AAC.1
MRPERRWALPRAPTSCPPQDDAPWDPFRSAAPGAAPWPVAPQRRGGAPGGLRALPLRGRGREGEPARGGV